MYAHALPAHAVATPIPNVAPLLRLHIQATGDGAVAAALLARLKQAGAGPQLFRTADDGSLSLDIEFPTPSAGEAETLARRLARVRGVRRIAGEVSCSRRGVLAGFTLYGAA